MTDLLVRQGIAKSISKAPISKKWQFGGIQLGHGLEVELCTGHVIRWRKRPVLFWNKGGRYLGLAEKWGAPTRTMSAETYAHIREEIDPHLEKLFKDFHGRNPRKTRSWIGIRMSGRWLSMGAVCRIDYASDKKGRRVQYTHKHGRGVKMYRIGSDRRAIWIIKGGGLTVTARGIVK